MKNSKDLVGIVAAIFLILGAILSITNAILLFIAYEILLGIVYLVVGIIVSWCLSILIDAFGDLVQNSFEIKNELKKPKE